MAKFKVGDRVRVLTPRAHSSQVNRGDVGTVDRFPMDGWIVFVNHDGSPWWLEDRDVEPVTASPDPLDYLKTTIRSLVGATSTGDIMAQRVLVKMAKDVYGLDTVFVPATADFVTVTQ